MADRRKLAQGLMMMTPAMREDLAGREQDIQRGKTVELLRRAGKEMYDNPIVNTAIGFTPVLGDIQAAGETMAAFNRGAPWQETAGYAAGMLPFMPMIGKTVWHGSPHTFDKFDLSKIGTGEGAQAYGHGLYLAEAPQTATSYAKPTIKDIRVTPEGKMFDLNTGETVGPVQGFPKHEEVLQGKEGSLYKVDLPDEQIAKMLDWDAPFAKQTPEVKEALKNSGLYKQYRDNLSDFSTPMLTRNKNMRGENVQAFVEHLAGSPEEASRMLREAGIVGTRYFDEQSRAAGKGTRNYVVFSDEIPQILERNGTPLGNAVRNFESPKQSTLQDVIAPIEQRGVTLDVYESNKKPLMTLSRIEIPKEMRGQGIGTEAMQDLVNYANQQGKTIALSPSTDFGGSSVNRLKDFYKQFGFVENKGRNKDFEISESMYRLPEAE